MKNMVHHQAIFYRGTLLRSLRYNDAYRRYGHDHEHNLRLWKMKARVAYIDRTIALWNSGGISDNANWEDYKEEFKVRRNVVGGSALLWDVFTLARFVFKRTSLRFKRFRHRALAPQ